MRIFLSLISRVIAANMRLSTSISRDTPSWQVWSPAKTGVGAMSTKLMLEPAPKPR